MKASFTRAWYALTLTALCLDAYAVPIQIDFAGTVNGLGGTLPGEPRFELLGLPVSGSFRFDTDQMLRFDSPDAPYTFFYQVEGEASGAGAGAFINLGTTQYTFPVHANATYSMIFWDGCQGGNCGFVFDGDFLQLDAISRDVPLLEVSPPGYTGSVHRSTQLTIASLTSLDWFDRATVEAVDALTMPLGSLDGGFGESVTTCLPGDNVPVCTIDAWSVGFTITSLTRGVVEATPVPEPGTLALFAAALLGVFASARRSPGRQVARSGVAPAS